MDSDDWAILIVTGVITLFIVGGALLVGSLGCERRWKQSGYETSWGPLQGCLIKQGDQWLPEKMLRRFDNDR